jgi:hypothetical protein
MTNFKTGAILSGLIYEEWPHVNLGLDTMDMDMVCEPFDIMGSQGMLVLGPTHAYLVFRGTEVSRAKLRDLISNFGVPRDWIGKGKAHSGYARHFSYIRGPARDFAERIPTPIPLIVTGHSMGGCLATLYASWVASGGIDDHKLAGLITYGAPKCLSDEAIASIACPVFRFTNRYDFAPFWPPIPGFDHPKNQVKINSGGWPGPVSRHSVAKYIRVVP